MHDSFSIVVAITEILIPNLHLQVYAYPKSSVVASRCLISSDHVATFNGNLEAIFTFSPQKM